MARKRIDSATAQPDGKNAGKYGNLALAVLVPVAIAAIVWYVTLPVLRYTLLMQEQKGLFLFTPDYFRQVFSDSWPVTTLISDFLVQFYGNASLGALITALIVAKTYMMVCTIFRFTSFRQVLGGLAAAGTWYAIAHANTPHAGVVILMLAFLLALASLLVPLALKRLPLAFEKLPAALAFKKLQIRTDRGTGWWHAVVAVALTVGAGFLVATDKNLRDNERWYAVEYLSRAHDWDVLLQIATPQTCRNDMSYTPYALLALNAKGQLGDRIYDYPVTGPESLGDLGEMNWSGYSLRSQIQEVVGGTNEAIHLTYQLGMAMPHGTCFGVLRQLIRLEIENGDYSLARKHAQVLARSPWNRKTAQSAIRMADASEKEAAGAVGVAGGVGTAAGGAGAVGTAAGVAGSFKTAIDAAEDTLRRTDAMVSENNAVYNLSAVIANSPHATSAARERLLCHLMLSGDMEGFRQAATELFGNPDRSQLPRYFREKL